MNCKDAIENPNSRCAESGYTLIEIVVVVLIIGILAVFFGPGIFAQTQDAKFQTAKTVLTQQAPRAIQSYLSVGNTPRDHRTITDEIAKRGIIQPGPWGKNWRAQAFVDESGSRVIDFRYGFGMDRRAARELVRQTREALKNNPMFVHVKYGNWAGRAVFLRLKPL